jgi:hypothetical protein
VGTPTAICWALACPLHIYGNFTLHHIERTGLGKELIQNVHVMHFAVSDVDKRGDIAMQIQQRVHLHRRFVLPKFSPRKEREAKIDSSRVQSIQTLVQIDIDRIARIERARDSDQDLRKVGIDPEWIVPPCFGTPCGRAYCL